MNMWPTRKSLFILFSAIILPIFSLSISGSGTSSAATNMTISNSVRYPNADWIRAKLLFTGRHQHTATLLSDGRVLVVGGLQERDSDSPGLASVEIFDPATRTWSSTGSLNTGRCFHQATLLANGQVLVTGGRESKDGIGIASVEIYDPKSESWDVSPSLSVPRSSHSATLLPDGKVLVAGGRFSSDNPDVHASAEIYDPRTESWSPTGSLLIPREGHSATLIPGGKVLVVGGYNTTWLSTSEIYDPVSGTWREVADPLFCHGVAHTATLLYDDRVLFVGGDCGGIHSDAEIYDPVTARWEAAAALPAARAVHTATALPDGMVLIVGGDDGDEPRYASALIYDPFDDTWRTTGGLTVGRRNHTATLLNDGSVLIVGGWSDTTTSLDITELYLDSIVDAPLTRKDTLATASYTPVPIGTPTNTPLPNGKPFLWRVFSNLWILVFSIVACLFALLFVAVVIWWIIKFSKPKKDDK